MAEYRRPKLRAWLAAFALVMSALPVKADSFQQMWMGRIARPPADNEQASVYWEDRWDARGKRFKPDEVSCAHRTEEFGTIFVVTNLDNGKSIECPVSIADRSHEGGYWIFHSVRREKSDATGYAASPCGAPAMSDKSADVNPRFAFSKRSDQ